MEVDLEEDHWVFDVLKKWVDGQLGAEVGPEGPVGIGGGGARSGNSEADCVVRSTEISQERIARGGVQIRQECFCG